MSCAVCTNNIVMKKSSVINSLSEVEKVPVQEVGSKGGTSVSANREHMARIGRLGGKQTGKNRVHMADIGRKGGNVTSQDRDYMAEIGQMGGEATQEKAERRRDEEV